MFMAIASTRFKWQLKIFKIVDI